MPRATLTHDGCAGTFDGTARQGVLIVEGDRFTELRKALCDALNTRPDAPAWLFDLCDAMDPLPLKSVYRK